MSGPAATAVRQTFRELHGIVVTAGLMQKTVKVRVGGQTWNKKLQKVDPIHRLAVALESQMRVVSLRSLLVLRLAENLPCP
jgi:small subunit ribosomal protein S17